MVVVGHKHCSGEEGGNPCIRNPEELEQRFRTNPFQLACGGLGKCDEKPWASSRGGVGEKLYSGQKGENENRSLEKEGY